MTLLLDLLSSTEFIAAITGSVVGTVGSALVSFWLARKTSSEVLKRDQEARQDSEKAAAYRTILKLHRITNSIYTLLSHINGGIDQAEKDNILHDENLQPRPIWQFVRHTARSARTPIMFEPDDFIPLIHAKQGSLISDCTVLSERCAELHASFDAYSELRMELQHILETHASVDTSSDVANAKITGDEAIRARFRSSELEFLLNTIIDLANEDAKTAHDLCETVGLKFKAYFKGDFALGTVIVKPLEP